VRRLIVLFCTLTALVVASVGVATSASAGTTCLTRTRHWAIRDGSVPVNVGWIELHVQVCTNGTSLTSSSGSTDSDITGPGTTAGFVLHVGSTQQTTFASGGFGGGHADHLVNSTLRDCLPGGITVWCSYSENFQVTSHVAMLNALNVKAVKSDQVVLHGRVFEFTWGWKCTNSVCKAKLS
jgi:hypothetical protein